MALAVTYTQLGKASKDESGYRHQVFRLDFGNGALTYATGPVLDFSKLGCPNELRQVNIMNQGVNGSIYSINPVTKVMKMFESGTAAGPLAELVSGDTPPATSLYVEVVGW